MATLKHPEALVEKLGASENISQPRPMASASKSFPFVPIALKTFYTLPLFNLNNLGKNQITLETFFLRVARTIISTKYYGF